MLPNANVYNCTPTDHVLNFMLASAGANATRGLNSERLVDGKIFCNVWSKFDITGAEMHKARCFSLDTMALGLPNYLTRLIITGYLQQTLKMRTNYQTEPSEESAQTGDVSFLTPSINNGFEFPVSPASARCNTHIGYVVEWVKYRRRR